MDNNCCFIGRRRGNLCSCCFNFVSGILSAIILFVVGLILGAVFAETLLANLAIIIASASILVIMLILYQIIKRCTCNSRES